MYLGTDKQQRLIALYLNAGKRPKEIAYLMTTKNSCEIDKWTVYKIIEHNLHLRAQYLEVHFDGEENTVDIDGTLKRRPGPLLHEADLATPPIQPKVVSRKT